MTRLDCSSAFEALERLLCCQDDGTSWQAASPSIERLRRALTEGSASTLDLAVLLRQAIAREIARRTHDAYPLFTVSHPCFAQFTGWNSVGLKPTETPIGTILSYVPWCPEWLDTNGVGVDCFAASEIRQREFHSEDCAPDPMLATVGRQSYRSRAQRGRGPGGSVDTARRGSNHCPADGRRQEFGVPTHS